MSDLEKVIHGLECCTDPGEGAMCGECPYRKDCIDFFDGASRLMPDALEWLKKLAKCNHDCKIDCLLESFNKVVADRDELLEKQKPVEPRKIGETWYCGSCGVGDVGYEGNSDFGIADTRYNYCPMCGRKVRWG